MPTARIMCRISGAHNREMLDGPRDTRQPEFALEAVVAKFETSSLATTEKVR